MSNQKKSTKQAAPPTVITLTLPEDDSIEHKGTLLIARGDLAHIRQFTYGDVSDITAAIKEAYIALVAVEAEPPVIPEAPKAAPKPEPGAKAKAAQEPVVEEEPTIDIPLKKGTRAVKISHLKIVGGETDAAAYRQAVLIAGKLIDGRLWDGQSPIRIADVYAVAKKMQYLTDKDLSLFTLEDFVQVGGAADAPNTVQTADEDAVETDGSGVEGEPLLQTTAPSTFSANGQHPDDAAAE